MIFKDIGDFFKRLFRKKRAYVIDIETLHPGERSPRVTFRADGRDIQYFTADCTDIEVRMLAHYAQKENRG